MKLPILNYLKITNVSLYDNGNPIIINFNKNSTLLAGVNGVGKSTLLNIITYALTGNIKNPTYKFKSIYDLKTKSKPKEYFVGRISQVDLQSAEVELSYSIDQIPIIVKRTFDFDNSFKSAIIENKNYISDKEYNDKIVELSKLHNFEQIIFIVLYILYFDEHKNLVFWDESLLTATINIIFNIDPNESVKVEDLYKSLNQVSSDIRNRSWQLKKDKDDLNLIKSSLSSSPNINIDEQEDYYNLVEKINNLENTRILYEKQYNNTKYNLSLLLLQKNDLEKNYEKKYEELFTIDININIVKNNNVIQELIENHHCPICNSSDIDYNNIKTKINNNICPICNSKLLENNNYNIDELKTIDKEIEKININIELLNKEIELLSNKLDESEKNLKYTQDEYNIKYENIYIPIKSDTIDKTISALETTIITKEKKIKELREEEKKYNTEIQNQRKKIINRYNSVKADFIPIFKELSESFIGLDVNIDLNESTISNNKPVLLLNLYLNNVIRDSFTALSESQRFFIDIAFRMAIIIFINKQNDNIGGTMLLDTPEGSLDIAYEVNAGNMLTKYASEETQLILTANINSSGLLYQIVQKSHKDKISLIDLKQWSLLTEVQNNNINILDDALSKIRSMIGQNYDKQ